MPNFTYVLTGLVSRRAKAIVAASLISAVTWPFLAPAQPAPPSPSPSPSPSTAASLGFTDHMVLANGVRLHYVTIGEGEPVLLVPGWPQSWYAWRYVMKDLAATGRAVFAIDPRGFGDSERPASGYDLDTSAADLHAFIAATGLARAGGIDVVSHDVGTWIAFAHAIAHPEDVRRLVLSEALIPGTLPPAPTPDDHQNVNSWHFGFNRLDDLPETLVAGHERAYLTWLFQNKMARKWAITPSALAEYVRTFSAPGGARAGFAYYRQNFNAVGVSQMKARLARKLSMPVLALGGETAVGANMLQGIAPLGVDVRGGVLDGCGHFLPEECPGEFMRSVREFWRQAPPQ